VPNPWLDVFFEDAVGSGSYQGFDQAQTTFSLGWVLEGWVRKGRVGVAEAGADLVAADARILRVEVAANTAEHFLASLANQARLERAEEAIALAERTVAAVTRRVRAGKAPTAELARAEAELATDRLARDDVAHELSAAYHRLLPSGASRIRSSHAWRETSWPSRPSNPMRRSRRSSNETRSSRDTRRRSGWRRRTCAWPRPAAGRHCGPSWGCADTMARVFYVASRVPRRVR